MARRDFPSIHPDLTMKSGFPLSDEWGCAGWWTYGSDDFHPEAEFVVALPLDYDPLPSATWDGPGIEEFRALVDGQRDGWCDLGRIVDQGETFWLTMKAA